MQELVGNTFGYLHLASLTSAFDALAAAGFSKTEIVVSEPHFDMLRASDAEMSALKHYADDAGIKVVSINPGGQDLVSANRDIRALAAQTYDKGLDFAATMGADVLVVVPGRRSPLSPMPLDRAMGYFDETLDRLLQRSRLMGITLALETCPFDFLSSIQELRVVLERHGNTGLGLTLDVANVYFSKLDVADQVAASVGALKMVHVSDTTKTRWSHSAIGDGEIDFAAVSQALTRIGYTGVSSYELADGKNPTSRLEGDLQAWREAGFAPVR